MTRFVSSFCAFAIMSIPALAADKSQFELKVVVKKESIAWPYEVGQKEFEKKLHDAMKKKDGMYPAPPAMDLVLQITNTGTEKATVYVDGDPNVVTLTLKGPGVVTAAPMLAFTTEFRGPKPVVLEPGKTHEVPLKALSDGFRKASRYIYPTAPGEYTLSATYQLSTEDGGKGALLKSGEAKFKVEEPK